MRIFLFVLICVVLSMCKPGTSNDGNHSYQDYCTSFNTALNGVFRAKHMDGTMTWFGGVKGTVDILGPDYNDMSCTYEITDCENGDVKMNCNGSGFDTQILLFSPDSIEVNGIRYSRIQ